MQNFNLQRHLKTKVLEALNQFPVCAVIGSRQIGKTTLAFEISQYQFKNEHILLDLENPSDLNRLENPQLYFERHRHKLIVIDEVQRQPELFPLMRYLVDQGGYKFLLLGSSSPELAKHSSESLAGRMLTLELHPFMLGETEQSQNAMEQLWLRGGYPLSYLAKSDAASYTWRGAFIHSFLERDLPLLGLKLAPLAIRRFWQMMAHFHGQIWNANKIAQSLDLSSPSSKRYMELMEQSYILRVLPAYASNLKKRLVKAPKVYFRDSGLLHHALNLLSLDGLSGHPAMGASWEGYAIEQIIRGAQIHSPFSTFYYYRSVGGAEVDLAEIRPDSAPILYEMKHSLSPKPSRGLRSAMVDLNPAHVYIVYPGKESYPLDEKISTLSLLMPSLPLN